VNQASRIDDAVRPQAGNRLLGCLPRGERQRFLDECDPVDLAFGTVLSEPGAPSRYVYFPSHSYISLLAPAVPHATLEVGLIGSEGMLGVGHILDVDVSPLQAVVAGPGAAMRMTARAFTRALGRSVPLQRQLNRYLYALMAQFAQSGVCARHHDVTSRLARWLLMTQDRAHSSRFFITHEFLATMLGVRRVGVTTAAGRLQRAHVIAYRRGNIEILDRSGLERASCDCYHTMRDTYDRFLA
jgi:CRP-like cAMP-binding protein